MVTSLVLPATSLYLPQTGGTGMITPVYRRMSKEPLHALQIANAHENNSPQPLAEKNMGERTFVCEHFRELLVGVLLDEW